MDEEVGTLQAGLDMTVEIVAAYVANNALPVAEVPNLIRAIHGTLMTLGQPGLAKASTEPLKPAVPIKKSVTDDYIVSMEDGKRYQALKRHLAKRGLTPGEVGPAGRLPDDGSGLLRSPLGFGEEHRAREQAPEGLMCPSRT